MPAQAFVIGLELKGIALGASMVLAGAIDAYILGKVFAPSAPDANLGSQNLTVRSSSEPHKIVYGRTMVSGTLVFLDALDRYYLETVIVNGTPTLVEKRDTGSYLNMAVALAAHEIDGLDEIWLGEEKVFQSRITDGKLELVNTKYSDHIEAIIYFGDSNVSDGFLQANVDKHYDGKAATSATNVQYYKSQGITAATANSLTIDPTRVWAGKEKLSYYARDLPADPGDPVSLLSGDYNGTYTFTPTNKDGRTIPAGGKPYSSSHKLINTAFIYLRLKYNPEVFETGIPNVKCVIRGKKVYDPRWDLTNIPSYVDRGAWAPSTVYSVNDKITGGGKSFICRRAHTSTTGTWDNSVFFTDFQHYYYWKQAQTNTDPNTWEWSDNSALCIRDYLTSGNYHFRSDSANSLYGIGVKENEIDDTNIIEAANICDEIVYLQNSAIPDTKSYDSGVMTLTFIGDLTDYYNVYESIETFDVYGYWKLLGQPVLEQWSNSGNPTIDYGALKQQVSIGPRVISSSSYDVGTNKTTLTYRCTFSTLPSSIRIYSTRFTINGVVSVERSPINILEDLLATTAGTLPYVQGKFLVHPGVYTTPTKSIGENNLAGPITIQGSQGSQGLTNTVKGTAKNPANNWEETDFAAQKDAAYITEDGGYELVQNVKYPFTTSAFDAQRLARISLQRARDRVTASLVCNLSVIELSVGEFIYVNIDRLGWENEIFSIISWKYQEGNILLEIRKETSAAYDWTSTLLTPIKYSPVTQFQVNPILEAITGLTLESGTDQLIRTADGSIVPRVKITWDTIDTDLGIYLDLLIGIRSVNTAETRKIKILRPEDLEYYLSDITEGDYVDVIATVKYDDKNVIQGSTPTSVLNHTVVGKAAPPDNISGFTSSITENLLLLTWDENTDIDFSYYEIREGASWPGTFIGTTITNEYIVTNVTAGTHDYWIKAIDTSGNESTSAVTTQEVIAAPSAVTDIPYSIRQNNIKLSWDSAPQGTFPVANYTITYSDGAGYLPAAVVDSTDYIVTNTWVGTRTYRVVAKDIYGNSSAIASEIITIAVPSAPSISSPTLNGDKVEFSWTTAVNTLTQFPLESYEIAYDTTNTGTNDTPDTTGITLTDTGASFLTTVNVGDMITNTTDGSSGIVESITSNTVLVLEAPGLSAGTDNEWDTPDNYLISKFILTTGTDGFSRRVDWLTATESTRTFRIRGIDHVGNAGNISTVGSSITSPGSSNITKQVIDNNVLLTWVAPTITPNVHLPINYYEIKKGATYGSAVLVGNISGLFAAVFETTAGTFTYWITAVDTAGNPGYNNSITAAVNQPPDYTLLTSAQDDFSTTDSYWLSRSFDSAYLNTANNVNIPVNITETWAEHFTNNSWDTIEDQQTATPDNFPIYIQPTPASGFYEVLYDIGTAVTNLSATVNLTKEIVAGDPVPTLEIKTAKYNVVPAGTVTTADVSGVTLTDSNATFTTETSVGSLVTNTTDGSTGIIKSITSNTELILEDTGLSGGGDDKWDMSDSYTIDNFISRGSTTTDSITAFITEFRYIKVIIDVASSANDTDIYELSALNIVVDVKEKTDAGSGTITGTGGTTVTFNKNFIDVTSITVTSGGTNGSVDNALMVYDFADAPNPTTFKVYAFADEGTEMPRESETPPDDETEVYFSWVARGY